MLSTLILGAQFVSEEYKDTTVCSPEYRKLYKYLNCSATCNFTYENSGEAWYCGRPKSNHFLCEDWRKITFFDEKPHLPLSDIDKKAFK